MHNVSIASCCCHEPATTARTFSHYPHKMLANFKRLCHAVRWLPVVSCLLLLAASFDCRAETPINAALASSMLPPAPLHIVTCNSDADIDTFIAEWGLK